MVAVGTLRRDRGGRAQLLTALARAHTRGIDIDWTAVHPGRRRAALPGYAFQHQRYWLQPADRGRSGADTGHAMISTATELPDESGHILTGQISLATHPWLADDAVLGTTLLPGSAFLELALRAAVEVGCERIDSLTLENPLVLDGEKAVDLHITVSAAEEQNEDRRALVIHSRPTDRTDTPWTRHATGTIGAAAPTVRQQTLETVRPEGPGAVRPGGLGAVRQEGLEQVPPAGAVAVDLADAYERLSADGYEYGPAFQGLRGAWRRGEEVFVEVGLPEHQHGAAQRFCLHPALLDAALHTVVLGLLGERTGTTLPFSWTGVTLHAVGVRGLRVRLRPVGADEVAVDIADTTGAPVATIESLALRTVSPERLRSGSPRETSLFRLDWMPVARTASEPLDAVCWARTPWGWPNASKGSPRGPTVLARIWSSPTVWAGRVPRGRMRSPSRCWSSPNGGSLRSGHPPLAW